MTWSFVRLGLFTGAFSIGMLLSHSGPGYPSAAVSVLNENAGASLVIACDNAPVVVDALKSTRNAVQLHCLQSGMVVVRDHLSSKGKPAFNRTDFVDHGL